MRLNNHMVHAVECIHFDIRALLKSCIEILHVSFRSRDICILCNMEHITLRELCGYKTRPREEVNAYFYIS